MREPLARMARRALATGLSSGGGLLWSLAAPQAGRAMRRAHECAEWLHESCVRGLRAINLQLSATGQFPSSGLIVSNHLSYLDILALSAALPCVFVSKAEVERWAIIGRYARWAGTVFVQSSRPRGRSARQRQRHRVAEKRRSSRAFSRGHDNRRSPRPALSLHDVAARH